MCTVEIHGFMLDAAATPIVDTVVVLRLAWRSGLDFVLLLSLAYLLLSQNPLFPVPLSLPGDTVNLGLPIASY